VRIAQRATGDFSLGMDRYVQPFGNKVILELKFTTRFPDWLGEMARCFNLTRSAAAKYCEGPAELWHPEHGSNHRRIFDNVVPVASPLMRSRFFDGQAAISGTELP